MPIWEITDLDGNSHSVDLSKSCDRRLLERLELTIGTLHSLLYYTSIYI